MSVQLSTSTVTPYSHAAGELVLQDTTMTLRGDCAGDYVHTSLHIFSLMVPTKNIIYNTLCGENINIL